SAVLVLLITAIDLPATKSSIANPPASDSGNNNSCRDLPGDMKYSRLLRNDLRSAVEVMTESKEIVLAARSFSATCAQATDDPAGPANTTNIVNLMPQNPTLSRVFQVMALILCRMVGGPKTVCVDLASPNSPLMFPADQSVRSNKRQLIRARETLIGTAEERQLR